MTKKILLALALTLGTATVAAPQASACGGYGAQSPEDVAVEQAVRAFALRRYGDEAAPYVYGVSRDDRRATAYVSVHRGDARVTRQVRLRRVGDAWRPVAVARA